ncbi:hypothetical protein Q5Y75_06235 [Ruegeria sp. 2205SS24-7]|uniref:hypothetical protein n=1 Tax=Ruegeria discodermiae TaxID=3064389 RepID=UPI0027418B75|nr:hypothetical protein [Ruegeria sp. 2205SS24-7]MDP5216811.1 hypothetical protein [Ruegeria sp. 2205SS24-7]
MVQNNKVLTVSYGTFSCTLEGFDDSFDTMKAIAEYFRDLASDDRYFGAEPPQPDAEMLARIAQREVSRQVEARTEQQHIVLRAAETETAPVAPAAHSEAPPQVVATPAPQPELVAPPAAAHTAPEPTRPETAAPAPNENTAPATPATPPQPEEQPIPVAEPVAHGEIVPAADSIAAKLKRIREVVSNADEQTASLSYSEDEHAEDTTPKAVAKEAAANLSEAFEEDTSSVEAFMSQSVETAGSDYEEEVEEPAALKPANVKALFDDAEDDAEDDNALFGDLDDEDGDDFAVEDDLPNILMGNDGPEKVDSAPVHVLRASTEMSEAQTGAASGGPDFASALSPDDEADLLRELTAVEAELKAAAGEPAEDEDETLTDAIAPRDEAPETTPSEHASLSPVTHEGADDNLSRLMAAADERLDNPEASTSRDTYSHLRAAVAAAEAERSEDDTSDLSDQTEEPDQVSDDLNHVVRPRRPVVTASAPRPRATNDRPAPLKLVAEQRVDLASETNNAGPVLPRRVASVTGNENDGENSGFAEYASENGAVSLPDLLEAAAAYMSFVEGREQFSRPQLMNKVRQLDNQEFNREDGLRSFGQLLRDGKIEKTSGGHFTASGEIGFRPDNRAAG